MNAITETENPKNATDLGVQNQRVVSRLLVPVGDYPFLCYGGNHHYWQLTGNRWETWSSNTSGDDKPEDTPVLKEYKCSGCGAVRSAC